MRWEADNDQSISKTSLFQLQQWFSLDVSHFFENRASKMGRTRFACMPYGFQPAVHNTGAAVPVEKLWEIDAVRNCCLSQKKWWFHHFRRGEAAGGPGWRGAFYTARVREWPSLDGWLLKNRRKWWMIVDFFYKKYIATNPPKSEDRFTKYQCSMMIGCHQEPEAVSFIDMVGAYGNPGDPWLIWNWNWNWNPHMFHCELKLPRKSLCHWGEQLCHAIRSSWCMESLDGLHHQVLRSAVTSVTSTYRFWRHLDSWWPFSRNRRNVQERPCFLEKRVYMRTYIYIHPYIHACMHAYIHTYIYIYIYLL